jgi:Flp pilus assembly pilin Flp
MIARFVKDETGQDLIEYSLLLVFAILASATLLIATGGFIHEAIKPLSKFLPTMAIETKEAPAVSASDILVALVWLSAGATAVVLFVRRRRKRFAGRVRSIR